MTEFVFTKAERQRVPLRFLIGGPSGSGKTYTALVIARAIAGSGRIALMDTEHRSSELYGDEFDFDTLPLVPPFTPERYRLGIKAAGDAGSFTVLIIDSITHEWSGQGGVLEMVDAAKRQSRNQYTAWDVPSSEHTKFLESILRSPLHVIATVREKMQYVIDQAPGKPSEIRKIGMGPIQREGAEFEFSVFAEMDMANTMTVTKSRYKALQGLVVPKPGEEFVGALLDEIERGAEVESVEEAATATPDDPSADQASGETGVGQSAVSGAGDGVSEPEPSAPDAQASLPTYPKRPSDCSHPKAKQKPATTVGGKEGWVVCMDCGKVEKGDAK